MTDLDKLFEMLESTLVTPKDTTIIAVLHHFKERIEQIERDIKEIKYRYQERTDIDE